MLFLAAAVVAARFDEAGEEAVQAEETESNAVTETAIAEEDTAAEESTAAFNVEDGEDVAAFTASENDAEEFAAEANSDKDLPDFDTESDESRAIAAMVADILGAQADTTAPKLIIGEGRNMKNATIDRIPFIVKDDHVFNLINNPPVAKHTAERAVYIMPFCCAVILLTSNLFYIILFNLSDQIIHEGIAALCGFT